MHRGHVAFSGFYLIVILILGGCTGQLQEFLDEEQPLALRIVSDSTANPTYSVRNQTLSFTVTLRFDRNGRYSILHGSDCSTGKPPAGTMVSGTTMARTDTPVSLTVSLGDIGTFGDTLSICASDSVGYRSAAATMSFAAALSYLAGQNEATGHGLPFNDGQTGEFVFFQPDWISASPNRGGIPAAQSARYPLHQAVFVDPNDNYRIKYFVADLLNARVLIFHSSPTGSSAAADVVIGQSTFSTGSASSGPTGLNYPSCVAVSSAGRLYICDYGNSRILGFNTIPLANGAAADFVIGQPDLSTNDPNNATLPSQAQRLFRPFSAHAHDGRFFVADALNHRVLVFNTVPTTTAQAADLAIGQPNTSGSTAGSDYTSSSNYLNAPATLAFDAQRLYIGDSGNHRVLVFTAIPAAADTRPAFVIGQATSAGAQANCSLPVASAQCFTFPWGMAVQGTKLAVADSGNHRVLFFDLPITADHAAAQQMLGQTSMTTSLPTQGQAGLAAPRSLLFDNGYIWISDSGNNRVVVRQLPY